MTRAQRASLERVQSDALRAPIRVPVVALHLETGIQYMCIRWEMMMFKPISRMISAGENRIARNVLDSATQNLISWALAVRRVMQSHPNGDSPSDVVWKKWKFSLQPGCLPRYPTQILMCAENLQSSPSDCPVVHNSRKPQPHSTTTNRTIWAQHGF